MDVPYCTCNRIVPVPVMIYIEIRGGHVATLKTLIKLTLDVTLNDGNEGTNFSLCLVDNILQR